MGTTKAAVIEDAEIVSTTPEQETRDIIVAETQKLIDTSIVELKKSTVTDQAISQLKAEYGALVIGGIDDLQGYKAVKEGASKLKKLRTSISKKREELTEPALKFQRALIEEEKRIIGELKPIEDSLVAKQKDYENAIAAKQREEYQRRLNLFTESGYSLINGFLVCGPVQVLADKLNDLTDSQLEYYIGHGKAELERQAAEEQRRRDEAERLKTEQEALAAERAELARLKAELEAQKKALETTYDTVVQPEQPVAPIEFDIPKVQPAPFVPDPNDPMVPPYQNSTDPIAPNMNIHPLSAGQLRDWTPKNEFERGFNAFRVQLVKLVGDQNTKLTRAMLTEWAWNLPPTDTKQ